MREGLAALEAEITQIFVDALQSIADSISALAPLIVPPTDLPSVIGWINGVIDSYLGPYNALLLLQTATLTKQVEALSALLAKAAELGCDT